MGCKFRKISVVNEPAIKRVENEHDFYDNSIIEDTIIDQQNITADDTFITKLIGADDPIEIQVADPEAFNNSFIQQRKKAVAQPSYRLTIESWKPKSLKQLVDAIKTLSQGKSLVDRHWIIFYWVTFNIEYDTVSYFSKDHKDQSAERVFRTKKGVCAGYANIYNYLCDQLQMPCQVVSGYAKGYGFDSREGAPIGTDHAWNVVLIDHHWYLMEPTWGAGHLNQQKVFERRLSSYYFLPHPNEMIYHHLPKDDKWQLLQTPIKMAQYMQMPKLRPLYFELNLELISPCNQAHVDLLPDKSYASVLIRTPSNVHLMADLELNNQKIDGGDRVIFDKQKQIYCCYFAPANMGKHKITIYGRRDNRQAARYNSVLELTLDVKQMPTSPISFPETWENFFDLGLEVIAPQNTHLIKLNNGETHTQIRIRTPENVELLGRLENENGEKVESGNRVYFDRQDNIWLCHFAPDRDGVFKAIIMAKKKSDPGSYSSAVAFKIEAKQVRLPCLSYPYTWPLFYDLGLKVEAPKNTSNAVWYDNASSAEVLIETPDDVELLGQLENENSQKVESGSRVYFDRRKNIWRCHFAPNRDGLFKAIIMAKKKSDPGSYSSAVAFKIEAKQVPSPCLSYPYTWPLFYDLGLKVEAPRNRSDAVWVYNASFAEVRIKAPDDVQLSCDIKYDNIRIENGSLAQFDNAKRLWQCLFAPERTGRHELIVYAKRNNDNESPFNAVVKFNLNVTKIGRPMKFPLIYTQFQTKKCQIHTPRNGILKKGSIIPIHWEIPGATDVNLTLDSKWLQTEGYTDPILQREISVGSKEVVICGKYGQDSNYPTLIKYAVQ